MRWQGRKNRGHAGNRHGNGGKLHGGSFLSTSTTIPVTISQPIHWQAGARFAELNYRAVRALADANDPPRWYAGDYFGNLFAPKATKAPNPERRGAVAKFIPGGQRASVREVPTAEVEGGMPDTSVDASSRAMMAPGVRGARSDAEPRRRPLGALRDGVGNDSHRRGVGEQLGAEEHVGNPDEIGEQQMQELQPDGREHHYVDDACRELRRDEPQYRSGERAPHRDAAAHLQHGGPR